MTAPAPHASALERCVGDIESFLRDTWGHRHHLHRDAAGFDDLLSFADVDHILGSMSLRTPAFRLVKDGSTLPRSSYTKSGRTGSTPVSGIADPVRIYELFRGGATIVLQGMHRFWRPLAELCRELELALGHPTQVNAYITPPGSRGLAVHQDSHDVFVLQAFGRKRWEVWDRPEVSEEGRRSSGAGSASLSAELKPGDCLYIPEGTPHAAQTQDAVSGHLTVGIHTSTWADVLRDVLKEAERDPTLRERLPAAYHRRPAEFAASTEEHLTFLERWLEKLDPDDVAFGWTRRFLATRPPLLTGALEGLLRLDEIDDETVVRRRPLSVCELAEREGRLVVLLGDRELIMPSWVEPAMRILTEPGGKEALRPADLADVLDRASRLVLVKRLVREGLLEVAALG